MKIKIPDTFNEFMRISVPIKLTVPIWHRKERMRDIAASVLYGAMWISLGLIFCWYVR